ncbi:MAG TPA: hypothetical protein DEQ30_03085 [Porphyromonadaceae bacterium]|nr:hypothetical protein [Porphyromonadaceae bacterium]
MKHVFLNLMNLEITFFFAAIIAALMFASCDMENDGEPIDESYSDYSVTIRFFVTDHSSHSLLNSTSEKVYNEGDIVVKSLQGDNIDYDIRMNYGNYDYQLIVDLGSYGSDGMVTNKFVIEWDHDKIATTDTIVCEIDRNEEKAVVKKMWVNGILNYVCNENIVNLVTETTLIKTNLEILDVYDGSSSSQSRVEKEDDGLIYKYWLTDAEGRETNVFSQQEVKDKGFIIHISATNATSQTYRYRLNKSNFSASVFDSEHKYRGTTCNYIWNELTLLYPGEIYKLSDNWCSYNEANIMSNNLLPAGKYYIYTSGIVPVVPNDIQEPMSIIPAIYARDMPTMILNFEVK